MNVGLKMLGRIVWFEFCVCTENEQKVVVLFILSNECWIEQNLDRCVYVLYT